MSIRLTNIGSFVEQVGRRREHRKRNELDTLDCVFIGLAALASSVCPIDLAQHPEFPGMNCIGWDVVDKEATLAEVHARYTGKLLAGSGPFTTQPVISTSRHLGSVSWTTSYSTSSTQVATTSYTVRYTAKGVTFKYLTNRRPAADFDGNFLSQAQPYLGYENLQQFQTSLSFATGAPHFDASLGYGGFVSSYLSWRNDLTDLPVNDLDNGWFEVSEVYMTQAYINSVVV
jgi:hypothetical protein